MRRTWILLMAAACWPATLVAKSDPELPAWDAEARKLSENGIDLLAGETEQDAGQALAPPTADEIAGGMTDEVPEEYWQAYFAERPAKWLVDPQHLLDKEAFAARLKFLDEHAADSAIDLFVYVFKAEQDIPGELRKEEVAERLFGGGRPAAIVFYHLGAPQRAALYLSPALMAAVPLAEQHRALESSVMQAVTKSDSNSQLEAFLTQMSIRVYMLERLWQRSGARALATGSNATTAVVAEPAQAGKVNVWQRMEPVLARARELLGWQTWAALGGVLVAVVLWVLWRRRARYRFPELLVEPRLGGRYAAGVGAVISFASAKLPPASQREQLPETLRR